MNTKMRKSWIGLLLLALVLASCSPLMGQAMGGEFRPTDAAERNPVDEGEPQPPPADPYAIRPPLAAMTVAGETIQAGLGTYCWTEVSQGVGLCLDAIGIPTQPDPVKVSFPFTARFAVPVEAAPRDVVVTVRQAAPELEMNEENAQGLRWWAYGEDGEMHTLALVNEPAVELDLAPGLYVLDLFVSWESLGDASYGFLVQVE